MRHVCFGVDDNVPSFQHPNVPNSENTEYILRPPKPLPYTDHQARKAMLNKQEENMEPPMRKPRAGTLPSSVPSTPNKKGPTEMPPPLAPITPRTRKTPAKGKRVFVLVCLLFFFLFCFVLFYTFGNSHLPLRILRGRERTKNKNCRQRLVAYYGFDFAQCLSFDFCVKYSVRSKNCLPL